MLSTESHVSVIVDNVVLWVYCFGDFIPEACWGGCVSYCCSADTVAPGVEPFFRLSLCYESFYVLQVRAISLWCLTGVGYILPLTSDEFRQRHCGISLMLLCAVRAGWLLSFRGSSLRVPLALPRNVGVPRDSGSLVYSEERPDDIGVGVDYEPGDYDCCA